jgi:Mn-dependent DtxR family transcriptional regulator
MTQLRMTKSMFRFFRAVEALGQRGQPATLAAVAREMNRDERATAGALTSLRVRGFVTLDESGIIRVRDN